MTLKNIKTTTTLLLHLHHTNTNSYIQLKKATSLSYGGVAKRLISLKKMGIIHRTGFQTHQLTAKGLHFLSEALGQNNLSNNIATKTIP